ncbi:MAG: LPXTG cell wall anchor domain-containing protein [Coriobacteriia bacterium]|nr:LPXTG cell wall anchor domain-containing protein [Coriobacteriia bacterium]
MEADPVTSYFGDHFNNNTLEDGRIWTDKSVSAGSMTCFDADGKPVTTMDSAKNEFLVTLSALGQSYNVASLQVPVDAVFVIDISSSMSAYDIAGNTGTPTGTTRDFLLVNALNAALKNIMAANPENRVSVIGYAGNNTYRFLNLDHYDLAGGDYFSITLTGSTHYVNVNPALAGGAGTTARAAVSGGTPTQLGIAEGAQMLTNNPDTEYHFTRSNGEKDSITRKPIMILMTDGDPTFGWLNYTMQGETGASYTAGNGNPGAGDIGTDLVTVLTAAHWKDRIQDHYYPRHDCAPTIYTLGVGVTGVHAPSVMDPAHNAAANTFTFSGTSYNLKSLLDNFTSTGLASPQISFPMNTRGTNTTWQSVSLTNTDHQIKSYAYTDGYYNADSEDALNDAFNSIAQSIITKGGYVTRPGEDPEFSGYLTMIDPLGKHMEFKESKGIFINGELRRGTNFARLISQGPTLPGGGENTYYSNYLRTLSAHANVTEAVAQELIESARAADSVFYNSESDFFSSIKWYADSDMKYVGNFFEADGTPCARPEGATSLVDLRGWYLDMTDYITEKPTNLSNIFMTITTALAPGDFNLRDARINLSMAAGQQAVRWYIPAAILPIRSVSCREDPDNPGPGRLRVAVDRTLPIKLTFSVGLRGDFDPGQLSDSYKTQFATPDGKGYYFFTNDWSGDPSKEIIDTAEASFTPHGENPYYFYTQEADLYVKRGESYVAATELTDADTYYTLEEYFDQNVAGYRASKYVPVDRSVTDVSTRAAGGAPFIEAGQPKAHPSSRVLKKQNVTQTNTHVNYAEFGSPVAGESYAITHYLGNNGRLTIPVASLELQKLWEGESLDEVWVQLYRNGEPYRAPLQLDEAGDWKSTIADLLLFETAADSEGNVSGYAYTIAEGSCVDGEFMPYDLVNPLEGYEISYTQPEWSEDHSELSPAAVRNVRQPVIGGDPGERDPSGEDPGERDPGEENPGGEEPGVESPGGEEPAGEEPAGGEPGGGEPGRGPIEVPGTAGKGKGSAALPKTGDIPTGVIVAGAVLVLAVIIAIAVVTTRKRRSSKPA